MFPNDAQIFEVLDSGVLAEDLNTREEVICPYGHFLEAYINERGRLATRSVPPEEIQVAVYNVICYTRENSVTMGYLIASGWVMHIPYRDTLEKLMSPRYFVCTR